MDECTIDLTAFDTYSNPGPVKLKLKVSGKILTAIVFLDAVEVCDNRDHAIDSVDESPVYRLITYESNSNDSHLARVDRRNAIKICLTFNGDLRDIVLEKGEQTWHRR